MEQFVIGVDVGTTGTKAVVFGMDGAKKGSGYQEYQCEYPHPNWVEQDAEMLGRAVLDVCAKAVAESDVANENIVAISVSAQRDCVLFIDDNGKALKMISWMDNRAGEEISIVEEKMGADRFYQISGLPLSTSWILPKILFIQKNEPQLWAKTKKIVQLHEYVLRVLGADDYYEDESDASFWGFWDTDKLCWHKETMDTFGITEALLPKVLPPGTRVGTISRGVAESTGLGVDTMLCVGAGDQNCAAIGAGVVRPGMASVSIGTGGLATVFLSDAFRDPGGKAIVTNSAVHGHWQLEGLQNGAAGVFRWFRDEIATLEKQQAKAMGKDPYERLNEMITESQPGARGLVFLPYLASAASPRYDPNARGSLIGLTFLHNKGDIARAMIEGITLEQKDILMSMRNAGVKIERIRIMGGATKSPLWNQLQADCYGCTVETLKITDAAVMGAALCACVGAGIYVDIPAAADALVRSDQAYAPSKEGKAFYEESYRLYCDAYEGLAKAKVFEGIAKRQENTN